MTDREKQKPLTVSSMARMKGKRLWVEDKDKPSVICATLHRCVGSPVVCFNMIRKDGTMFHADVDDMDVRWRCWASKPTVEERMAAEWLK